MSRLLLPLGLALSACTPPPEPIGVAPRFDPSDPGFYATPWPSDARVSDEGGPDWSAFPNPTDFPLLDRFLALGSSRPGFAHNAAMYVAFEDDPVLDDLPVPSATILPDSPLQIVDVDPGSPTFGERTPVRWEWRDTAGTYVPERLLSIAPIPGWPLRPDTTYALVLTRAIVDRTEAFEAAWGGEGPWADSLDVLRGALPDLGLDEVDVGLATVFTTGDPVAEMERVARFLDERIEPAEPRRALEFLEDFPRYTVYRSDYTSPLFMAGDKPYANEGGAFVFRDDGFPEVQSFDAMRLSVTVPTDPGLQPAEGWPVVVYQHGTGGDYRTFCNASSDFEVATWLGEQGIVGLGIDMPIHGPRGTPDTILDLHSFNVLQPDSALHIHRQGAADLLYLLHTVAEGLTFETPDGTPVPLDPSRVVFMGHSQGGLSGALALPWMGELVDGAVLSGAGGLLAITAVERDADVDFPGLIKQLLSFAEDEELTELHPILGLVQTLVEPTDPVNYAPWWFHEDRGLHGHRPVPVLLTSGLRDEQTPSRTAEALAAAAFLPFAGERHALARGMQLRGFDTDPLPLAGNVPTHTGQPMTGGLSQWFDGDHFVVFRDPDARDLVRNFVATSLRGDPTLDVGEVPPPSP